MTAPATPAPADGAPGERESVDSFELDALRGLVRAERTWNDYAWRLAARGVLSSAAPLPAPASAAGVGAETISDEVHDAIAMLMTDCYRDGATGVETAVAEHSRQRLIAAHLDALSTAAAPVRPSREAVEDRETLIVETIDAELVALQRHAGDVANSSEGGASETDWANGVDYAARAIRQALDLATIRPAAPESEVQS